MVLHCVVFGTVVTYPQPGRIFIIDYNLFCLPRMMKCRPEQRITPFNAMQHVFLNSKNKLLTIILVIFFSFSMRRESAWWYRGVHTNQLAISCLGKCTSCLCFLEKFQAVIGTGSQQFYFTMVKCFLEIPFTC